MNTVTFYFPLGSASGMQPFPARSRLPLGGDTTTAFAQGDAMSRRTAVQCALLPGATVASRPAQLRAIECLRTSPQANAVGARRTLDSLDLLRMVADFDARGLPAPLYAGPAAYAAERECVGVVLGLLILDGRLFAVVAINDELALEVEAKEWTAVSADMEGMLDAETHSGVRDQVAGVSLLREAMPGASAQIPLALASPAQRAQQKVGQYAPEQNAILSVALDMAEAGVQFKESARAASAALTEWRTL